MRKISPEERKTLLVNLLIIIDKICRDNGIKYSLIGGSLIGAIRHNGIIPWDDDIDIILFPDDYKRLIDLLKEQKGDYLLLDPDDDSYPYPFAKFVDARTTVVESRINKIENYGVYLDIFSYHYISNKKTLRMIHYYLLIAIKKLFGLSMLSYPDSKESHIFMKKLFIPFARILSSNRLKKILMNLGSNNTETDFVMSNWPVYGVEKEVQFAKMFKSYHDCSFEKKKVMVCDGYDNVLRTTFGDYMKLPPVEKRKSNHKDEAYWR